MRQSIWNERLTPASFTTHHYAGSRHLAVYPDTGKPMWLLGDHLGSATLVLDLEGHVHSLTRYKPWGETLYAAGSPPSAHGFTDQRRDTRPLFPKPSLAFRVIILRAIHDSPHRAAYPARGALFFLAWPRSGQCCL